MRERSVKIKQLTVEGFLPYGTYTSITEPEGYKLSGTYHDFYRDLVRYPSTMDPFCYSSLVVRKNPEMIITGMEYHDYVAEIQLPMDTDAVLVTAPANGGDICLDEAEAFLIPKGTLLCLHRGTWHDVLYPANAEKVHVLIGLPERIYHNDIVVKNFEDGVLKVEL